MRKRLALFLSIVMLIGLIPIGYAITPTDGETLRSMGLLTGDQLGNLNENQYLTRAEMVVVLARMVGEFNLALDYSKKSTFTDENNHWAERYVSYAQYRGWTAGIGNNMFGYDNRHTVQEASVFMLKALGYIADVDFTWANAYTKAAQLGLFSANVLKAGNAVLRGDLFSMMLKTLNSKVKGLNVTLGQVLNITPPAANVFEAKSAKSSNLKEIIVTFSKPLDINTVRSSDFTLEGNNFTAQVLPDGFTVSLTAANALSNWSQYALTVDNIRSTDGMNLARTTLKFIAGSTLAPSVIAVKPSGVSSIEITFSEPIMTTGTVSVSSPNYSSGVSRMTGIGTNKIIVDLSADMTSGRMYEVAIRDFKDHVSNTSVNYSGTMFYTPDTTTVTAKTLDANQRSVSFEFNKLVRGLTTGHFYHTYAAWNPLGIYQDEAMTIPVNINDAVSKVYVKFAMKSGNAVIGHQLPSGAVNVTISEYNSSAQQLLDNWGNAFSSGIYRVNVVVDTVKPTVTKLEMTTESVLTLEFSEIVKFGLSNIEIQYSTGAVIPGLWLDISGSGKTYSIELQGVDLAGKAIKVILRNVEDEALLTNVMGIFSKTMAVPDYVLPYVTKVVKNAALKSVYISFSEHVNTSSAQTKNNYTIYYGSSSLVLSRTPINFIGEVIFRLDLSDTEYALAETSGAQLLISGVKDRIGNTMDDQVFKFSSMTDVYSNKPVLESVKATGLRTLTAVFDQVLTRVDLGALKVAVGTNVYSILGLSFDELSESKTSVTLMTSADMPYNLSDTRLIIDTTGTSKIQNVYTINVANTSMAILDRIKPSIAKTGIGSTIKDDLLITTVDGKTTVSIKFTEPIKTNSVLKETFLVDKAVVDTVFVSGNSVVLTIIPEMDMLPTPSVTMQLSVQDLPGNTFKAVTSLQTYKN